MTIFEQMGNISSEVGRSFNAKHRNNNADLQQAIERAIDLFDATIYPLIDIKSPRAKEIMRAKESYLSAIFDKSSKLSNEQSLERYFMQYSVANRLNK